jgi:hypothetical protein
MTDWDDDVVARQPPEHIVCVDCGGRCHLLTAYQRDDDGNVVPFDVDDIVAYRCEDCMDRWDIVLE